MWYYHFIFRNLHRSSDSGLSFRTFRNMQSAFRTFRILKQPCEPCVLLNKLATYRPTIITELQLKLQLPITGLRLRGDLPSPPLRKLHKKLHIIAILKKAQNFANFAFSFLSFATFAGLLILVYPSEPSEICNLPSEPSES